MCREDSWRLHRKSCFSVLVLRLGGLQIFIKNHSDSLILGLLVNGNHSYCGQPISTLEIFSRTIRFFLVLKLFVLLLVIILCRWSINCFDPSLSLMTLTSSDISAKYLHIATWVTADAGVVLQAWCRRGLLYNSWRKQSGSSASQTQRRHAGGEVGTRAGDRRVLRRATKTARTWMVQLELSLLVSLHEVQALSSGLL